VESFLNKLKSLDNSILLFINSRHSQFWDGFMMDISNRFIWIPLYLFLAFLIYREFGKKSWIIILFAIIAVALSDQLASHLVKNIFMRYRPSHNLILSPQLHFVDDYKGGLYGFASSHASNTFSLTVFIMLLMPKNYKLIAGLFCWVVIVCYSRMYLGVHYPSDIIGGALIGILSAWISFRLCNRVQKRMLVN
jgi:undecaprenyl-diphosphatase